MTETADNFAWAYELKCPAKACTDFAKKRLCKGMGGLLWEIIASATYPASDVIEIKKNILLHKLTYGLEDSIILDMKTSSKLQTQHDQLDVVISALEKEYKQQNFLVRRKLQRLKEIRGERSILNVKKNILTMKHEEVNTQFSDCGKMILLSKHLMPRTVKNIDDGKITECHDAVSSLLSGANKKQVWQTISNTLGSIEVPILWDPLYKSLQQDVNRLIKLGSITDISDSNTMAENIDVGIAKACGQYAIMVAQRLRSDARASNYQQCVMELIEKIEISSVNGEDENHLSDWLAVALEIRKFEAEQMHMQEEIDRLKQTVDNCNELASNNVQVMLDIQSIDIQIDAYVQDVQQSLIRLRSASSLITKLRDKLQAELQKIAIMRADGYSCKWTNDDLNTELDIFYDALNLKALRKITVAGDYRYTKCCFNEASVLINPLQCPEIVPHFPMLVGPIYCLIDCYKHIIANFAYRKLECLPSVKDTETVQCTATTQEQNYNTLELLKLSETTYEDAQKEIQQFHTVLNEWMNQSVQEVGVLRDKYVDDISFLEWLQRYSLLVHVIQSSN